MPVARLTKACVMLLCLALTGCSAYTKYDRSALDSRTPTTEIGTAVITVGQTVKVLTTEGDVVKGSVESLADTALVVEGRQIPHAQVAEICVRSLQWAPTLAVSAATALVYVIVTSGAGGFSVEN